MAVLGGVTEGVVARIFPLAPPVSKDDLQGGSDWAEEQLERFGTPVPETGTRQFRELQRAVSAYALYLATGGNAASSRLTSTASTGAVKSIALGTLKLERTAVNTEAVAAGMVTSAAEWLEMASRHLAAAGFSGGWGFPGAAR